MDRNKATEFIGEAIIMAVKEAAADPENSMEAIDQAVAKINTVIDGVDTRKSVRLYTCPSECLFAHHPGREHDVWIAEDGTRKRLDMLVGTSSRFEEAVTLILTEFDVTPKVTPTVERLATARRSVVDGRFNPIHDPAFGPYYPPTPPTPRPVA